MLEISWQVKGQKAKVKGEGKGVWMFLPTFLAPILSSRGPTSDLNLVLGVKYQDISYA